MTAGSVVAWDYFYFADWGRLSVGPWLAHRLLQGQGRVVAVNLTVGAYYWRQCDNDDDYYFLPPF